MIASILWTLFHIFIFPGFLFMLIIGLLLAGIDRKVVARMQKRVGPPIRQPWYDFLKLWGKENIIPDAANRTAYIAAPIAGLVALIFTGLFLFSAFLSPIAGFTSIFSSNADLIIILYLLTIPGVCIIVGGAASGNPFAGVGLSREMVAMLGYELPLVMVLLTIAKKTGEGAMNFSLAGIAAWNSAHTAFAEHWALIPAAIAMLLVIPAEVGTNPFDVAEAETEICEGPLVEYSGKPLAVFKLNTAFKMFIMTSLFTFLFFGGVGMGINTGITAVNVLINAVILVVIDILVTIVCITTANAVCARLKVEHLFKFYWTVVAGLALISLVLVWIGL